jgi:dimethylamine/trimethylamine dehydrogenase
VYVLSRRFGQHSDEDGDSLENHCRLLRELVEETKDAIGDTCAVPCRILIDELVGEDGIHAGVAHDIIGHLVAPPFYWNVALSI